MSDASTIDQRSGPAAIAPPGASWHASEILQERRAARLIVALRIATDIVAVGLIAGALEAFGRHSDVAHPSSFTMILLFVTFAWALGLYATAGVIGVARLRLRTTASVVVMALAFLVSAQGATPLTVMVAVVAAMLLVVVGHYAEAMLMAVVRHTGLRGALARDLTENTNLALRPSRAATVEPMAIEADGDRVASVKRSIDLLLAVPLGLAALPIVGALALAIVLASRSTPFYWHERIGYRGKPIRILKLRTMYVDADSRLQTYLGENPSARAEWERFFKLKHDPRVLPIVGNFVRCCSLDELPQFWNVIRGDMSLVGPRPFPAYHLRAFDPEFQTRRADVRPGLTGLWQISARSNGDIGVQKEQDGLYLRNWSLWLDFYILLETLPAVLRRDGAR